MLFWEFFFPQLLAKKKESFQLTIERLFINLVLKLLCLLFSFAENKYEYVTIKPFEFSPVYGQLQSFMAPMQGSCSESITCVLLILSVSVFICLTAMVSTFYGFVK